jgi:hypothetical protein
MKNHPYSVGCFLGPTGHQQSREEINKLPEGT